MARIGGIALAIFLLIAGGVAVYLYGKITTFETSRISDDVTMIRGVGGNVGVLRTAEGVVIVDTMSFVTQGREIRELAERIGGGPTLAVINTHYHLDHTHGNPGFAPGTRVVSTGRTLDYLRFFDGDYWAGDRGETLPSVTFDDRHELRLGGKTIRLYHFGRGHTGGDLVVLFVEDRVLHAGDLFFNGTYPNIDLEAGGSVREWSSTLDRVLELEFDHVIPGHGPATDRAALRGYQGFVEELWEQASAAAGDGLSLEATLATVDLEKDDALSDFVIPFVMTRDRDFAVRRAWEEASGAVSPAEVPKAVPR